MKKYVLLAIIGMCQTAYCLTLDNIIVRSRFIAGDPLSNQTMWFSTSTIINFANDAQLDIVTKTGCMDKVKLFNISNGTGSYVLPTDFVKEKRVAFATSVSTGNTKILYRYDLYALDSLNELWESTTTAIPDKYYIQGSSIVFVPIPNVTGLLAKMVYIPRPTDMSAGGNIPFDNDFRLYPYHRVIIPYVVSKLKENRKEYNEAQYYMNQYISELQNIVNELRAKIDYIPQYGGK